MAKDITIKNPQGTVTYYPKTVSQLVYDNENGKTVKTEIDEIKFDIVDKTNELTNVGYIDINGNSHTTYTTFNYSQLIEVNSGDVVKIYGYCGVSSVSAIYGYDADKNGLRSLLNGTAESIDTTVTIGEDVKFIRVSLANSTNEKYVDGSYVNVKYNILSGVKDDIESLNADIEDLRENRTFKVRFTNNKKAIKSDGSLYTVSTFDCSPYITVSIGTKIIVNGYSGAKTLYSTVYGYDENKQPYAIVMDGFNAENKVNQIAEIIDDNIKYVMISVANSSHAQYVRNDCYIIATTDFITETETKIQLIEETLTATENPNLVPTDSRLDANTVIASDMSNGWALFLNDSGSVQVVDDYVEVTCPNLQRYEGIRNDNISSLGDWRIYDEIKITAEVRWASDNSPHLIYFYWDGNPNYITIMPSKTEWTKISKILKNTDSFKRMQFCLNNTQGVFQVRNFKIANANKPILERLGDLEETTEELNERVTLLEQTDIASPLKGKKIAVIGDSISTISNGNTPSWKIKASDVGKEISAYVTYYDIGKTIGGVEITNSMYGYLQTFTPTSEDVGKEIGTANNYNNAATRVWSQQLCDLVGCELVCNASWSGAQLVKGQGENEDGTPKNSAAMSYAWSDYTMSRFSNNLDESGNTIVPDVIFIYRGTNDATHSPHGYCTKLDMKDGIPTTDLANYDGTDKRYFQLAANILVSKLRTLFPNVTIYFCTLNYFRRGTDLGWTRKFSGNDTLAEYNDCIRDVANKLGCGIVNFDKDGITPFVDPTLYYRDGASDTPTHPNTKGHLIMAQRALKDVNYIFEP